MSDSETLIQNKDNENEVEDNLAQNSIYQNRNLNGKFTPFLLFCVVVAVIGSSFQYGWNMAMFNTPEDIIKDFYKEVYSNRYNDTMSNSTMTQLWSLTNGLMPFGGIIGGMSSGFLADNFGRKNSLLYTNILVVSSGILNIMSKYLHMYELIMAARFITGLFCGFFTGILPIYLYEIAPENLKGLVGTLNQLNIVTGILASNILGLPQIFGTKELWPVLCGIVFVPVLVHVCLIGAVKSPKFLFIKRNDKNAAEESLIKLRGIDSLSLVENELAELEDEKLRLSNQTLFKWSDFWYKSYLFRPLVVTIVIQMSQQLSGIIAVIFYSTSIFKNAGLSDSLSVYCTILLGVVQVFMTLICVVIIDKVGRRILLIIGNMGMCVSAFGLSIFSILANKHTDAEYLNYLTIFFSVSYIFFFSVGPGAIPWIITSELFGSEARGKAVSLSTLINWSCNFLVTVTFPFIQVALGSYSFLLFGFFLLFFSVFMLFFVPETKGRTSDDIKRLFEQKIIFFNEQN